MHNEKDSELALISVIVPVYNLEKYLHYSIRSVLNQTYSNLQIIMVDDGSTDNSGRICDEYADEYPMVRCIHQANAGVSAARNRGITEADGDYIMFLDGDDIIAPNAIEILINDFEKTENCIFSGFSYCRISNYDYKFPAVEKTNILIDSNNLIEKLISGGYENIGVWGKIFPRRKIRELCFTEGKGVNEDKFFLFQYLMNNPGNVSERHEQLYGYYTRPNSSTTAGYSNRILDVIYFSDEILKTVKCSKSDLIEKAEYNDLVAHLIVTKSIMRSGCYTQEKKTFKSVKKELETRYGKHKKTFYGKYYLETKILLISDFLYGLCVKLRDGIKGV